MWQGMSCNRTGGYPLSSDNYDNLILGDDSWLNGYVCPLPTPPYMEIVFKLHGTVQRREVALRTVRHELECRMQTLRETQGWIEVRLEKDAFWPPHEVLNRAFRDRFNVTPNLENHAPRWERNRGTRNRFESEELGLTLEVISARCSTNDLGPAQYWGRLESHDPIMADRAELARRREAAKKREQEAEDRATALLKQTIGSRAFNLLLAREYLTVKSPSTKRHYRIRIDGERTQLYEGHSFIAAFCIDSVEDIPNGDRILLHKLMIEGNEEEYQRTANWFDEGGNQIPNPYRGEKVASGVDPVIRGETVTAMLTDEMSPNNPDGSAIVTDWRYWRYWTEPPC